MRKWRENEKMKRKWRENEEMKRKWRENEGMERKWRENQEMERYSLSTFLFVSSLSINSLYKNGRILSPNVKYYTFVANVTQNLTYAL